MPCISACVDKNKGTTNARLAKADPDKGRANLSVTRDWKNMNYGMWTILRVMGLVCNC